MRVQPIPNSKSGLNWKNLNSKIPGTTGITIKEEDKKLAFVSDYFSPTETITKYDDSKSKPEKPDKRSKPLSFTSENWIG